MQCEYTLPVKCKRYCMFPKHSRSLSMDSMSSKRSLKLASDVKHDIRKNGNKTCAQQTHWRRAYGDMMARTGCRWSTSILASSIHPCKSPPKVSAVWRNARPYTQKYEFHTLARTNIEPKSQTSLPSSVYQEPACDAALRIVSLEGFAPFEPTKNIVQMTRCLILQLNRERSHQRLCAAEPARLLHQKYKYSSAVCCCCNWSCSIELWLEIFFWLSTTVHNRFCLETSPIHLYNPIIVWADGNQDTLLWKLRPVVGGRVEMIQRRWISMKK